MKQQRFLLRQLKRQGWRIRTSKKGWMLYPPDRAYDAVPLHKTYSDHRWWQNMIHDLRKKGYTP
ncbi:hypothetical protein BCUN_0607 [Bifidobacterium cuniculi]|uniref:Type II toxin-antitoxin system HicA family toxin n=1 Tax=Bifidobacterium cuniculi TaxID=1688 RepID=A0A087B503_9BIFI|nr:hypothetical protein BCUN_0607 [Bifidobacterium cuniculi]